MTETTAKWTMRGRWGTLGRGAALAALALAGLTGCAHVRVDSIPNQQVAALSPEQVTHLMYASGFTDKQILRAGVDLRNALALSGAAQVRLGRMTEAIYAVDEPSIYVSTHKRGSFIYNMEKDAVH